MQTAASIFDLKELEDGIWALTFDLPGEKVNKLNSAVMAEFEKTLDRIEKMPIAALVLRSGKKSQFIAGADIEMIQTMKDAKDAAALSARGQALMNRWEDLPFPTIAAINGPALGGGFEFALACRAIVASDSPAVRIGLPEVLLGLLPGMGGCLRLPRKLGVAQSLDLILTGKTLSAEKAFKAGAIEAVLPEPDFDQAVLRWIKKEKSKLDQKQIRIAREPKLGGMGGFAGAVLERTFMGRRMIFKQARAGVLSKTRGQYPAPLRVLQVMERSGAIYGPKATGRTRERALQLESEAFGELAVSDVSRNLVRLFFLTEAVKKSNGVSGAVHVPPMHEIGVLGAGVMGGGIAQLVADRGMIAHMKDLTSEALQTGIQSATRVFQGQLKRKKITQREYLQKLGRIAPTLEESALRNSDVVIEAIVENLEVKKKVLSGIEKTVSDECILASNTSSLSITQMQTALAHPERFVGMHFFNPVHKMPLIEVIRGEKTADLAVATIFDLSKKLGKTPIVVKDAPGFLVNRLLAPYLNEATYLLTDGAQIEEIDAALLSFGMPMGPMELIDEVGVDVAEKVAHILNDAFGARMLACPLNAKLVASKRLGKKNGRGLYVYDQATKGKGKSVESDLYALLGLTPKSGALEPQEMVERCILPMINEAARCLDESVVETASEVDLGMIMGTGFPPFRGGLLRYADSLGLNEIVSRLRHYEKRFGARFEPSDALIKRAESGVRFYPE